MNLQVLLASFGALITYLSVPHTATFTFGVGLLMSSLVLTSVLIRRQHEFNQHAKNVTNKKVEKVEKRDEPKKASDSIPEFNDVDQYIQLKFHAVSTTIDSIEKLHYMCGLMKDSFFHEDVLSNLEKANDTLLNLSKQFETMFISIEENRDFELDKEKIEKHLLKLRKEYDEMMSNNNEIE